MKNVLFLSYYFPPAGGSAVQRTLKFVKYLPEFGWMPHVISADPSKFVLKDTSLVKEIPSDVEVDYTPAPDLYNIYSLFSSKSGSRENADLAALSGDSRRSSFASRAALFIRSSLFIPDARVGWLPYVLKAGGNVIRRKKIDVIFATAPPFTTLAAGAVLSKRAGIPLVTDYRDPWTGAYFYFKRPYISARFEEFLERKCLESAYRVVSINQRIAHGMRNVCKDTAFLDKKIVIIPNGYDPEDFEQTKPVKSGKVFTIVYTGTQHARMNSIKFIKAVEDAVKSRPELKRDLLIKFIGRISEDVAAALGESSVRDVIELTGHMGHRECLNHTAGADLLLLLIPETPGNELIVTGKVFEYLRSGRPVLCLAERGDAPDIIRRAGAGIAISPDKREDIKDFLLKSYGLLKKGSPVFKKPRDLNFIESFDRKKAAQRLSGVLGEALHKTEQSV